MTLTLSGAAGPTPQSTSLNGGITPDIMGQIRQLCSRGDFVVWGDGHIAPWDDGFCERISGESTPDSGCLCLCRLIGPDHDWELVGTRMDDKSVWPETNPNNGGQGSRQADGSPGTGTGGTIRVPTTDSAMEYGAYDPKGNKVYVDYVIVLGHELCGHAAHFHAGDHDPRPRAPNGLRPGHDQAVQEENRIRRQQGMNTMRGEFADPHHGESFARRWF